MNKLDEKKFGNLKKLDATINKLEGFFTKEFFRCIKISSQAIKNEHRNSHIEFEEEYMGETKYSRITTAMHYNEDDDDWFLSIPSIKDEGYRVWEDNDYLFAIYYDKPNYIVLKLDAPTLLDVVQQLSKCKYTITIKDVVININDFFTFGVSISNMKKFGILLDEYKVNLAAKTYSKADQCKTFDKSYALRWSKFPLAVASKPKIKIVGLNLTNKNGHEFDGIQVAADEVGITNSIGIIQVLKGRAKTVKAINGDIWHFIYKDKFDVMFESMSKEDWAEYKLALVTKR